MYLKAFLLRFDHFLDPWAEICQIFRWFFGKFKKIKKTFWNYLTFRETLSATSCLLSCTAQWSQKYSKNNVWILISLWFHNFYGLITYDISTIFEVFLLLPLLFFDVMLSYLEPISTNLSYTKLKVAYSSNEIRKTKNKHLIIVCQNLIVLWSWM